MGNVGLFIGAGASCELAMPLVWELTHEIKEWLTPDKLRSLNAGWKQQGGGYEDQVIEDCANILTMPNLHYESILGYLETQFRRNNRRDDPYHGIYCRLIEIISYMLYERHVKNQDYILRNMKFFEGIRHLAEQNSPLWIFSLNHDLLIECLAAHYSIPLSSGFTDDIVTLPRRNRAGVKIGELRAQVLTGEQLEKSSMSFLKPQTTGINLLKIHGALDVFTFRDGKDLLKLLPLSKDASVQGLLESLRAANEELLYVDGNSAHPVKTINEITYADESGEMQFLRRTLLSGAYKYDKRVSQVLPICLLNHFQSNLNHVSKLICIGYGFGDEHINKIIRQWLEFSAKRSIEVVNPGIKDIPASLLHISAQVTLTQSTMSDYLDSIAGIKREKSDGLVKQLGGWSRKQGDKEKSQSEFGEFLVQQQQERIKSIVDKIVALPRKGGDIDLSALGMTKEEFISKFLSENEMSIEGVLESFLKSRGLIKQ